MLALEFLKKGSLSRAELLALFDEGRGFKSSVKPTLSKLNRALKTAIGKAADVDHTTVEAPIFHDETSDRWHSRVRFGYTEDADDGLTLQSE